MIQFRLSADSRIKASLWRLWGAVLRVSRQLRVGRAWLSAAPTPYTSRPSPCDIASCAEPSLRTRPPWASSTAVVTRHTRLRDAALWLTAPLLRVREGQVSAMARRVAHRGQRPGALHDLGRGASAEWEADDRVSVEAVHPRPARVDSARLVERRPRWRRVMDWV